MPNGSMRRYGSFLAASSKGHLWPNAPVRAVCHKATVGLMPIDHVRIVSAGGDFFWIVSDSQSQDNGGFAEQANQIRV